MPSASTIWKSHPAVAACALKSRRTRPTAASMSRTLPRSSSRPKGARWQRFGDGVGFHDDGGSLVAKGEHELVDPLLVGLAGGGTPCLKWEHPRLVRL